MSKVRVVRAALPAALLLAACTLLLAPPRARADFDEHVSLKGKSLLVVNLLGEMRLEASNGSTFEIDVAVRGKDATRERIQVESQEGDQAKLVVRFPVDEEESYIDPDLGHFSRTEVNWSRRDEEKSPWLRELYRGERPRRIKVSATGSGMDAHAILTVKVPRGAAVTCGQVVGPITAQGLRSDVTLDTYSGELTARQIQGNVALDTGSGDVSVTGIRGDVGVDTGSGDVDAVDLEGAVSIDTGSGGVSLADVKTSKLHVDTGSGSVRARGVSTDAVDIDTGSGSVELELARMGTGHFKVDTGSGSIRLRLPDDASAHVEASTGSGGIHVDLEGAKVTRMEDDEAEVEIGTGAAKVVLDTGSGSIRISRSR